MFLTTTHDIGHIDQPSGEPFMAPSAPFMAPGYAAQGAGTPLGRADGAAAPLEPHREGGPANTPPPLLGALLAQTFAHYTESRTPGQRGDMDTARGTKPFGGSQDLARAAGRSGLHWPDENRHGLSETTNASAAGDRQDANWDNPSDVAKRDAAQVGSAPEEARSRSTGAVSHLHRLATVGCRMFAVVTD